MQRNRSASISSHLPNLAFACGQAFARFGAGLGVCALMLSLNAAAQNAPAAKETVRDGYAVHQSVDIGGHISDENGSLRMYDTLVTMHSGARILQQSLEM